MKQDQKISHKEEGDPAHSLPEAEREVSDSSDRMVFWECLIMRLSFLPHFGVVARICSASPSPDDAGQGADKARCHEEGETLDQSVQTKHSLFRRASLRITCDTRSVTWNATVTFATATQAATLSWRRPPEHGQDLAVCILGSQALGPSERERMPVRRLNAALKFSRIVSEF